MSLNKEIDLTGNVGKIHDPKMTDSGKFIFKCSLAVTVGWGDNKSTEWYDVVGWEKTGEIMYEHLTVGSRIRVRGDFKMEVWKSKEGEPKGKIVVTAKEFQFLSGKPKEKSDNPYDEENLENYVPA